MENKTKQNTSVTTDREAALSGLIIIQYPIIQNPIIIWGKVTKIAPHVNFICCIIHIIHSKLLQQQSWSQKCTKC